MGFKNGRAAFFTLNAGRTGRQRNLTDRAAAGRADIYVNNSYMSSVRDRSFDHGAGSAACNCIKLVSDKAPFALSCAKYVFASS